LTRIFLHAGSWSSFRGQLWGAPVDPGSEHYDGHSFVTFLQNHDQVGNRATGDRIHHRISPGRHAAAITLILLLPGPPLLSQGAAAAALPPFTSLDHLAEHLGPLVSAGRAEEFARMGWYEQVPAPQGRSAFESAFLRWDELATSDHARMLEWYRQLS